MLVENNVIIVKYKKRTEVKFKLKLITQAYIVQVLHFAR